MREKIEEVEQELKYLRKHNSSSNNNSSSSNSSARFVHQSSIATTQGSGNIRRSKNSPPRSESSDHLTTTGTADSGRWSDNSSSGQIKSSGQSTGQSDRSGKSDESDEPISFEQQQDAEEDVLIYVPMKSITTDENLISGKLISEKVVSGKVINEKVISGNVFSINSKVMNESPLGLTVKPGACSLERKNSSPSSDELINKIPDHKFIKNPIYKRDKKSTLDPLDSRWHLRQRRLSCSSISDEINSVHSNPVSSKANHDGIDHQVKKSIAVPVPRKSRSATTLIENDFVSENQEKEKQKKRNDFSPLEPIRLEQKRKIGSSENQTNFDRDKGMESSIMAPSSGKNLEISKLGMSKLGVSKSTSKISIRTNGAYGLSDSREALSSDELDYFSWVHPLEQEVRLDRPLHADEDNDMKNDEDNYMDNYLYEMDNCQKRMDNYMDKYQGRRDHHYSLEPEKSQFVLKESNYFSISNPDVISSNGVISKEEKCAKDSLEVCDKKEESLDKVTGRVELKKKSSSVKSCLQSYFFSGSVSKSYNCKSLSKGSKKGSDLIPGTTNYGQDESFPVKILSTKKGVGTMKQGDEKNFFLPVSSSFKNNGSTFINKGHGNCGLFTDGNLTDLTNGSNGNVSKDKVSKDVESKKLESKNCKKFDENNQVNDQKIEIRLMNSSKDDTGKNIGVKGVISDHSSTGKSVNSLTTGTLFLPTTHKGIMNGETGRPSFKDIGAWL